MNVKPYPNMPSPPPPQTHQPPEKGGSGDSAPPTIMRSWTGGGYPLLSSSVLYTHIWETDTRVGVLPRLHSSEGLYCIYRPQDHKPCDPSRLQGAGLGANLQTHETNVNTPSRPQSIIIITHSPLTNTYAKQYPNATIQ